MTTLSRRELLRRMSLASAAGFFAWPQRDWFGDELVCIHIYGPKDSLPAPLLEKPRHTPARRAARDSFQIGLPELVFFKDPSQPPYLCDYAARQKGFKKPPP